MHFTPHSFHSPHRAPERRPVSRRLVSANEVCAMLGVTDRTLLRWINDPALGFPQPRVIRRTRYWGLTQIERFIERQFGEPSA